MRRAYLLTLFTLALGAQTQPAAKTGPAVGSHIPDFSAADQNGNRQTLETIRGPNGAVLVFFRSADW